MTEYPWLSVSGFGTHIKSTQTKLIIQKKNSVEEYPLDSIKNLLIIGGHTLSSSTITNLVKKGAYISFFEPDCTPIGIIRPFGDKSDTEIYKIQQAVPRHRYATAIAQAAIKSRLFAIEHVQEMQNSTLFYEGEQQFLHTSEQELQYLIKLDEIRRLHRLTADMYYEIMSRNIPPDFGYRRRTIRPQSDPVNAMLSFGYAMLFGNCCVSLIGARLDPDSGLMYEGKGSLVQDLIEPLKADMIDRVVFQVARETLSSSDFEQIPGRCMLSDDLIHLLIGYFHSSIDNKKIDELVYTLYHAMMNTSEFIIRY
ncbi:MAG TPA: CRISPR-associated endonuclease Cas1 [Methanoregula sp.]|nr:CRISPR-associated endonuclease Cas1 [Methanoregula sp.]